MKIKETKEIPEGTMGIASGTHSRVRALHYHEEKALPELKKAGAEVVPEDTPVSEWTLVSSAKPVDAGKGGK
jgi:hypothetical protein